MKSKGFWFFLLGVDVTAFLFNLCVTHNYKDMLFNVIAIISCIAIICFD